MKEEVNAIEPKIRFNLKKNFKGETGGEITVRGETIGEIQTLLDELRPLLKSELEKFK